MTSTSISARRPDRGATPDTDRQPLQFTASEGPDPAPEPASQLPAAPFNPVGELVAGAASALTPVGQAVDVSIPRIAIHIFAERQDTLAAAERAGQDRRLSRTTTQVRLGGVAAAVETYSQNRPRP